MFVSEFRHRLFVFCVWMLAFLALNTGSYIGHTVRPGLHWGESTAQRCAHSLGISYTYEDGATEKLDDYDACIRNASTQARSYR